MDDRPDAITRFAWHLRHHWRTAATAFLLVGGIVVGLGTMFAGNPVYVANALVVPTALGEDLDALRLSRFQQAVFESGGVLEATLEHPDVPYSDRGDLLDHVHLSPVEDNIALRVVARTEDPGQAATISNVAAEELVSALNRTGPAAGQFVVHTPAAPPADPEPALGLTTLVAVAALGGLGAAGGLVGAIGAMRRPMLAPDDAAAVLGEPALGRLRLPRSRGAIDPSSVLGLSALVSWLYPNSHGVCAFVAPKGAHDSGLRVASLVTRSLARRGKVLYVATGQGEHVTDELLHPRILLRSELEVTGHEWASVPTVVEGPEQDAFDLPQTLPGGTTVVIVVPQGTPASRLRRLGQQFLPGEVGGVLFIQYERRSASGRVPARPLASDDTATLPHG